MKNWTQLNGGAYVDGDALWARQAKDGSWFLIRMMDLWDAIGEREARRDSVSHFEASVRWIDLKQTSDEQIKSALASCGYRTLVEGGVKIVVSDSGDEVADGEHYDRCVLDCLVAHGSGAPIHDEYGNRAINVRARARREAERLMRDADAREKALDKPVNKIGSTAREYGAGDVTSALLRGNDPEKRLMRKLHGMPEDGGIE